VDPVLAKCLEDQLARDFNLREDSGSDDGSDTFPIEWETVSELLTTFRTYSIRSVKNLLCLL
jgi:hypothetical protein